MCLAIPGKLISIEETNTIISKGKVDFNGVTKDVILSYVPEAQINDYVLVHAGFAMSVINEVKAKEMISLIENLDETY